MVIMKSIKFHNHYYWKEITNITKLQINGRKWRDNIMNVTYYKASKQSELEEKFKNLALEKGYKFYILTEVLNEKEILKSGNSSYREFLKEFGDEATIKVYMIKHRKDNYFIYQGQAKGNDSVGIVIVHHQKTLKQIGKVALAFPLAASGIFGAAIALGLSLSGVKRSFSFKGKLMKSITDIINDVLGDPMN